MLTVGACGCGKGDTTDGGIGHLDPTNPGPVQVEGEVSMSGDLFYPRFIVSDDSGSAVVWYDPPLGTYQVSDGSIVQVEGELQAERDPSSNKPLISASRVRVLQADPASAACEDAGGTLEIRTYELQGDVGWCIFDDGTECVARSFFDGECGPGGS